MGMNAAVIGAGLAGLMAAKWLAELTSATVYILSDGAGASPFVHGINMPLHPEDSIGTFIKDTMDGGYGLGDMALISKLCCESLEVMDDLAALGIHFDRKDREYSLLKPLGSTYPRVAGCGNDTGVQILRRLKEKIIKSNRVKFLMNCRALDLVTDKEEKFIGINYYTHRQNREGFLRVSCVIMAGGGYCGIYPFSTNPGDSGGDGIAMAYRAGLRLTDMEFIQFEPSAAVWPDALKGKSVITTMFYEGAVLRNRNGKRFLENNPAYPNGEQSGKDTLSRAIYEEILAGKGTAHSGVYFDATGVGREKLEESYYSYLMRYQKEGIDLITTPFEIAPAPHTSLGGIVIDSDCRTNIAGIFAAGEAAGGVHGANRIGGNAGLETLVFGRRAGISAAKYLNNLTVERINEMADSDIEESPPVSSCVNSSVAAIMPQTELNRIRGRMQSLLSGCFYVIRNETEMISARDELKSLLLKVQAFSYAPGMESYGKKRLQNDLTCAWLLACGASERAESVGCHWRADSAGEDHDYHIYLQKQGEELLIDKKKCEGR